MENTGGGNANPNNNPGAQSNAGSQSNSSQSGGTSGENLEARLNKMEGLLETYKRQVSGSQEEAVRLKKDRDSLATQVSELQEALERAVSQSGQQSDDSGSGQVEAANEKRVRELESKVEALLNKESKGILEGFLKSHPGLTGENLNKFQQELDKLSKIYTEPGEAMQKAFVLINGPELDAQAKTAGEAEKKAKDLENKSNSEKDSLTNHISDGGDADKGGAPAAGDFQNKLEALQYRAMQAESQGRDATALWAEVTQLRDTLAAKV